MIGTHGTALSTILHFYNPDYSYEDFGAIRDKILWIIQGSFDDITLRS